MICKKCGTANQEGSKFCIKCGNNLVGNFSEMNSGVQNPTTYNQVQTPNQPVYSTPQPQPQIQPNINTYYEQPTMNQNYGENISIMEGLMMLLAVLLKPASIFQEYANKLNDFKNSIIVTLVTSLFATLVSLATTVINTVRVTSLWSNEVSWEWDNLEHLDFVKIIGTNFMTYLGIIVAIAVVYYVGSLIVKKTTNFAKLLGTSALAVIPLYVCWLLLSPILTMLYAPLGIALPMIGLVYTVILIFDQMNQKIAVEGDSKYYFNLVCLSLLAMGGYYLYMKVIMASLTSGLSSLLDMFG